MSDMPTLGRSRKRPAGPAIVVVTVVVLVAAPRRGGSSRSKKPRPRRRRCQATHRRRHRRRADARAPGEPRADGAGLPQRRRRRRRHRRQPPPPAKHAPTSELEKAGLKRAARRGQRAARDRGRRAVGPELGPRLVQVLVRSLVWWLAVPGDLRHGDLLDVLYEERAGEDPIIHVVRYQSGKSGAHLPRLSLQAGRLAVAALLHARRRRARAAPGGRAARRLRAGDVAVCATGAATRASTSRRRMGSPVKAPFDGTSWRARTGTGRATATRSSCAEAGGHGWTALFLHLSELPSAGVGRARLARRGRRQERQHRPLVRAAPALPADGGQKILDPFAVQETSRKKLPERRTKTAFADELPRLDHLLDSK